MYFERNKDHGYCLSITYIEIALENILLVTRISRKRLKPHMCHLNYNCNKRTWLLSGFT